MNWDKVLKSGRKSMSETQNADDVQDHSANVPISENLADNLTRIENTFTGCQDIQILQWRYGPEHKYEAFSVYFDTLIQKKEKNYMKESLQDLVTHEVGPASMITPEDVITHFNRNLVSAQSAALLDDFDQAVLNILDGSLVIFFDTWNKAISYEAAGLTTRQNSEPMTEPVVMGPHISMIEGISQNIGLLRSLLKTPLFKIEKFTAGVKVKRSIAFGYLEGAVNPETLAEFKRKIAGVEKEEVLETSYIEEWIEDKIYSPFPQFRYTERPDTVVAALLNGKIIVMVDGTPMTMICPGLFVEFFQSSEDYYSRTMYASLIRLLRIVAFIISLALPSVYIALTTFHPELIPTVLLLAILDSREGIPFPAFAEALIMEFFFELLREAGIRLPRPIGSAVSIVGALVIGQAAIQAKIASPIMVVVVSLTGIASFALPQYNMSIALRILRFPLMVFAASMGGLGIMISFLLILLHLVCLQSLGRPYLSALTPFEPEKLRDIVIRAPLQMLSRSPRNKHLFKKNN